VKKLPLSLVRKNSKKYPILFRISSIKDTAKPAI
jgi:hypothetical protein